MYGKRQRDRNTCRRAKLAADSAAVATALAAVSEVQAAAAAAVLAEEAVALVAVNSVLADSDRMVAAVAAKAIEKCTTQLNDYAKLDFLNFSEIQRTV